MQVRAAHLDGATLHLRPTGTRASCPLPPPPMPTKGKLALSGSEVTDALSRVAAGAPDGCPRFDLAPCGYSHLHPRFGRPQPLRRPRQLGEDPDTDSPEELLYCMLGANSDVRISVRSAAEGPESKAISLRSHDGTSGTTTLLAHGISSSEARRGLAGAHACLGDGGRFAELAARRAGVAHITKELAAGKAAALLLSAQERSEAIAALITDKTGERASAYIVRRRVDHEQFGGLHVRSAACSRMVLGGGGERCAACAGSMRSWGQLNRKETLRAAAATGGLALSSHATPKPGPSPKTPKATARRDSLDAADLVRRNSRLQEENRRLKRHVDYCDGKKSERACTACPPACPPACPSAAPPARFTARLTLPRACTACPARPACPPACPAACPPA